MARKKSYAVIGLNNLGVAIVQRLVTKKQYVTVFDLDQSKVNNLVASYEQVDGIALDATIKNNLIEQGLDQYDTVIITIATNIEANVLTIIGLKDVGVNNIIAKAKDQRHIRILKALGITNIIQPDEIAANIIVAKAMYDVDLNLQTVDENYASVIISITEPTIEGQSLFDLRLLNNKDYNIVHIKRKGKIILPADIDSLKIGDEILFIAKINVINELKAKLQKIENSGENSTAAN